MTHSQSKRPLIVGISLLVVFAIIYGTALVLYANSGRSDVAQIPAKVDNGVQVQLQLVDVDSLRREVTMRIAVFPVGNLDLASQPVSKNDSVAKLGFAKPVRVTFWQSPQAGSSSHVDAGVGQAYVSAEVKFLVNGNPDTYPLDHYLYGLEPDPEEAIGEETVGEEVVGVSPRAVPFLSVQELDAKGNPVADSGEQFITGSPHEIKIGMDQAPEGTSGWTENWNIAEFGSSLWMDTTFKRAGGTLGFVVVVMILMAVLAVAALSVSIRVFRKPGTIEATMASWQAALLFALVPLRNFLPGAPPIGVWIDVLVFYWVILALMFSMALFTYTWLRDRGHLPGEKKAKQAKKTASKVS